MIEIVFQLCLAYISISIIIIRGNRSCTSLWLQCSDCNALGITEYFT